MKTSKPTTPRRPRWLLIVLPLLLLLLVCGAIGIWLATSHPAQAHNLGTSVSILTPATGDFLDLGTPLRVTATGSDPKGVTRLELYIGGVLTAVQTSTGSSGSTSLEGFAASWTPTTTGRYYLMARSYRSDGHFADSSVILVDVIKPSAAVGGTLADLLPAPVGVPCPDLNHLASMLGVSLEDLLVLNPSLRGTDAGSPVDCSIHINLPRPAAPPPGLDGGTPGGPGSPAATPAPSTAGTPAPATTLAPAPGGTSAPATPPAPLPGTPSIPTWVTVDPSGCTSVILTWSASPDAEGYTLYRIAPGESRLNAIAHLPASQTTYTDPITNGGTYTYEVAAVRSGLEALSTLWSFNTRDFPTCASRLHSTEPPAESSLYLILPSLETVTPYEGVYCYVSLDGGAQGRLPEADFSSLTPLSDGLTYDLRTLPARGHYLLTRTGSDPVTLEMRCMGRRGVYSDSLGGFLASHPSTEWDGHMLSSNGTGGTGAFSVNYCITPDPTLTDCISSSIGTPPVLLPFTPPLAPILLAWNLPAPANLRIQNNLAACDGYSDATGRLNCMLRGGDPMLSWDWSGAGPYTESTLTGYHVAVSRDGNPYDSWDITPGSLKNSTAYGTLLCGITIAYQVTAVQGALQSPPSAPLSISSPACPTPTRARVRVIFDSLTLGPSPINGRIFDHGDLCIICTDNEFEISGGFSVQTVADPEGLGLDFTGPAAGDFVRLDAPSVTHLADQWLQSAYVGGLNNNFLVVDLTGDSQTITIGTAFLERDFLDDTSLDCVSTLVTPAHTIAEWATINETGTLSSDPSVPNTNFYGPPDDLGCSVTFRLIGEPLP